MYLLAPLGVFAPESALKRLASSPLPALWFASAVTMPRAGRYVKVTMRARSDRWSLTDKGNACRRIFQLRVGCSTAVLGFCSH